MPNFSSRKHITVFTTSWEVCEPNYSSYIIVKHSTQVPSLLVRGGHFIYLLQLVVVCFVVVVFFSFQISVWLCVVSWNCSYFGQENRFIFCDMLSVGDIREQIEECDIRFRLCVGANFLGLMSQLSRSITSNFFLKVCIKSHCLSPSWQMFILQTSEVLRVRSFSVSITTGQT